MSTPDNPEGHPLGIQRVGIIYTSKDDSAPTAAHSIESIRVLEPGSILAL